jgi:hypothetical protein
LRNVRRQWVLISKECIIVDLDGTISDPDWRLYGRDLQSIDWNEENQKAHMDPPYDWCVQMVKMYRDAGYHLIFLTARTGTEEARDVSKKWLDNHVGGQYTLFMRDVDDHRNDDVVKHDIYYREIFPHFKPLFALDDKPEVINMWRNLGITALHCRDYMLKYK